MTVAASHSQQRSAIINKLILAKHLKFGTLLHSSLIKTALIFTPFLSNRLIQLYSKCYSIQSARATFDDAPLKNHHSWNTLISAYCNLGQCSAALELFDQMPHPNLVTFNSLISGLSLNALYLDAIRIFRRMRLQFGCHVMDGFTIVGVIGVCASLKILGLLRQVHAAALVMGMEGNRIVSNALVDAYGKCAHPHIASYVFESIPDKDAVSWTSMAAAFMRLGRIEDACRVFRQMPGKNTISWTSMIAGLAQNGSAVDAMDLFIIMVEQGAQPNAFTFVSSLSACADLALLGRGKQLHGYLVKRIGNSDLYNVFVVNALIDMYCKCSNLMSARNLFNGMPEKDIVTWNSMITGCAQNGFAMESLSLFTKMTQESVRPNHVTFLGVLVACGHTGLIPEAFRYLEMMEKDHGLSPKSEHYAVLVDLLGRRNKLYEAVELIEKAPVASDRIRMWGSLLSSSRLHGDLNLAVSAAEFLYELEPENSARFVTLSHTYAAADRWDDSRRIWQIVKDRGLSKESAYSWIEVRNERHSFTAKSLLHTQTEDLYDTIHGLVYQMNEDKTMPGPNGIKHARIQIASSHPALACIISQPNNDGRDFEMLDGKSLMKNPILPRRRHTKNLLTFLSYLFTFSALNMSQIHDCLEGPSSSDLRFPDSWGENDYRPEEGVRGDEIEPKLLLKADIQDDYLPKADVRPLLPTGHPCSHLSPRPMAQAQAFAKSGEKLMKMIRDLPESSYELSLKDIVDLQISQETKPDPPIGEEPGFALNYQHREPKKKPRKKTRSDSMDNSAFLIETIILQI